MHMHIHAHDTYTYTCTSHTCSSTMSLSAPEPNLQAVTGVTDWDFLRPSSASAQDDHAHRPSLDDFDGEISVFQVCNKSMCIIIVSVEGEPN